MEGYQKRKTMIGWPCLEEPKSAATCSDRTESCKKNTFGKTKNALERCHKKGGGSNRRNLALNREGWKLVCETGRS